MIARELRVRRRGFFLHTPESGDTGPGELDNPEGFVVRRQMGGTPRGASGTRSSGGRQPHTEYRADDGLPAIRSGSVTGSRQRLHLSR